MNKFILLSLMFPVLVFGQAKTISKQKKAVKQATVETVEPLNQANGFVINGSVKGYPDGTTVALLNGQTGEPESETTIQKNSFMFKGKLTNPDFKILLFNKLQPYITLFLDNSNVVVKAVKDSLEKAVITGSASHTEYNQLLSELAPYQQVFAENAPFDSLAVVKALQVSKSFVNQHSSSFISPLAIIRFNQLSDDMNETETLYNTLALAVKATAMGNYVGQQIAESKRNAIGSVLADFTQADTLGKPVSLTSYRGKYVLIDFWASWCRPCRQENPNVVANYNRFKDKNFTVLGVSLDKAKNAWVDAINVDGLAWSHVSDLQGWTNSVAQQFNITSIPQNFLIGPDGKIIGKNLRGPALERKLAMLLK